MIRIRFHGRGGHGIKTAGRIVGTAAFLAGSLAQDSPLYGAERRGAAVAAYSRIDREPIRERGVIEEPDLIVVGDETLLDDPGAGILEGQHAASAVFVNTAGADAHELSRLARRYGVTARVLALDITGRTLDTLGRASALSAGLAAAAARITGVIGRDNLIGALREELGELPLARETLAGNVELASEVFDALPAIEFHRRGVTAGDSISPVGYDDPLLGTPTILVPGNAELRRTGSWRTERPEIDYERCTRCSLCFVRCPDGTISLDERAYPVIDYDHCKGCLICFETCPLHAIERRKEVRAP